MVKTKTMDCVLAKDWYLMTGSSKRTEYWEGFRNERIFEPTLLSLDYCDYQNIKPIYIPIIFSA